MSAFAATWILPTDMLKVSSAINNSCGVHGRFPREESSLEKQRVGHVEARGKRLAMARLIFRLP